MASAGGSGKISIGAPVTVGLSLLLAGLFLFLPTTILLIVGMIPTMVAFMADPSRQKHVPLTVAPMNLLGILPYLIELWQRGESLDQLMRILGDPVVWMIMYLAAGAGWVVYFSVPYGVAGVMAMRAETTIAQLEKAQQTLVEEWGEDVKGAAARSDADPSGGAGSVQAGPAAPSSSAPSSEAAAQTGTSQAPGAGG